MSDARCDAADPKIGMVLQDRYRIVRKLGDGGMATVYEGEHIVIKRRVAIKVLHARLASNPEITARFRREAEAATSIGHPHVVEVTDMGSFPDGSAYMVLELLDGRDWAQDIGSQGPQPLGKVARVLSQVCDALSAAHAKGIVHRDLKPENIFLIDRHGDPDYVKVVDFGISKILDGDAKDRCLTQTGAALGTPYYMPPEQCQGRKDVDLRADLYSLGVVLFRALTGQYPFDAESYPMLVLKICTEPPPALSLYRRDVPPELQAVLQTLLAKDRAHRYESCAEVKAALAPYLDFTAAPIVAPDAPSTLAVGPAVLARPGRAPVASPGRTVPLADVSPAMGDTSPSLTPHPLEAVPSPTRRGRLGAVAGAAAAALLALVGVGAYAGLSERAPLDRHEEIDEATRVGNPPPAEHGVAVTAPRGSRAVEGGPPAPPPATVHVTIRAPEGVTLRLDDEVVPNPFVADIARGRHRVSATGDGYEPYEASVDFHSDDQRLPVPMTAVREPSRAAPGRSRRSRASIREPRRWGVARGGARAPERAEVPPAAEGVAAPLSRRSPAPADVVTAGQIF